MANIRGSVSSAVSAYRRVAVSPLLEILEQGVRAGTLLRHPCEPVYCGFGSLGELSQSGAKFVPMNSNRVINEEVVQQRMQRNLKVYRETNKYLDFGEITLLVHRNSPASDFFIMDGQHRIRTMEELHKKHPGVALNFHFRVVVVTSEKEAYEALMHFQDCFPADPRAFLKTQNHTQLATTVIERLTARFPTAFKNGDVPKSARAGGGHSTDPHRPFLNDYLVFWLLDTSGVLEARGASIDTVMTTLLAMNTLLAGLSIARLGPQVTEHMRAQAEGACCGCYLGFFRDGKLEWNHLANQLPPPPPATAAATNPLGASGSNGGSVKRQRDGDDGGTSKFCVQCGNRLGSEFRFCNNCGTPQPT